MGKYIGKFYKLSQSQLSNPSIKAPVISSLTSQTSSSIELTITYVPYVIYRKQNNSVLCFKNSIYNDLIITNNDYIQSYETQGKKIISFQLPQLQIITHSVFLPHQ